MAKSTEPRLGRFETPLTPNQQYEIYNKLCDCSTTIFTAMCSTKEIALAELLANSCKLMEHARKLVYEDFITHASGLQRRNPDDRAYNERVLNPARMIAAIADGQPEIMQEMHLAPYLREAVQDYSMAMMQEILDTAREVGNRPNLTKETAGHEICTTLIELGPKIILNHAQISLITDLITYPLSDIVDSVKNPQAIDILLADMVAGRKSATNNSQLILAEMFHGELAMVSSLRLELLGCKANAPAYQLPVQELAHSILEPFISLVAELTRSSEPPEVLQEIMKKAVAKLSSELDDPSACPVAKSEGKTV